MAAIKLRGHHYRGARYGLQLTCDEHPDFNWTFDAVSWVPDEWETALTIAYGHHVWAHA